ncbi:MAG TPA: hypothetical protein VEA63_00045 [Opitutus sp.]|nr:hypothetical protein [Opitutus sp.]
MALPRIKLIWGGAKQAPGHWRLGIWGVRERQVGSAPRVVVSVRGILSWMLGLAFAGYLVGATALYVWFERNPYNLVRWTDTLLMPLRWDQVRELRGRMMIAEGLDDLRAKRWGEAHMKLRVGLARAPAETRARLALAEFYNLANRRPDAIKLLAEGLKFGYPGRQYLGSLFGIAAQSEDYETIMTACDTVKAPDEEERAWLLAQKISALISAKRAEEALALIDADGEPVTAQMREARVLALVETGRSNEAIAFLQEWLEAVPAHHAQVLRLQARAFREAGRTAEMVTALENLRQLAPTDPRTYIYGIVQRFLAGEGESAVEAFGDFVRRFGSSAQSLALASSALAEAKALRLVERCAEVASLHGFPAKTFKLTLAQALIAAGEWRRAGQTLAELKPVLTDANPTERFSYDSMERVVAIAIQPKGTPESPLLDLLQQRPLPLSVYRHVAEALLRADRPDAAKSVLAIAERIYPVSATVARLRAEAEAGLETKTTATAAAAVVTLPSTRAAETEEAFFERLNTLEAEGRWREMAEAVRQARVSKPAWLARREAEVFDAQMRTAIQTLDTPELLAAARLYLNGMTERSLRVVDLARGLGVDGRKADGERLIVEVLRKSAGFAPALRLREEWRAADEQAKVATGGE